MTDAATTASLAIGDTVVPNYPRRSAMTVDVHARLLPARTPAELLALARRGLDDASQTNSPGLRYGAAYLAALRAGAAMLALRANPIPGRPARIPGVWQLLAQVAPEMAEWADHFANTATKRAAVEAGLPHVVTLAEDDSMARSAEAFVAAVEVAVSS